MGPDTRGIELKSELFFSRGSPSLTPRDRDDLDRPI
jgi:hypothetical protein